MKSILYGNVCRKLHIAETELLKIGISVQKQSWNASIHKYIEDVSGEKVREIPVLYHNKNWYIGIYRILEFIKNN